MDPTGPSGHHPHRAAAVVGEARSAVARLSGRLPGSHREPDSDGRSLVIAVGRATPAGTSLPPPSPATDPYETTASLLAWGSSKRRRPTLTSAAGCTDMSPPSGSTPSRSAPPSPDYAKPKSQPFAVEQRQAHR
jgi:hypothetical protein